MLPKPAGGPEGTRQQPAPKRTRKLPNQSQIHTIGKDDLMTPDN